MCDDGSYHLSKARLQEITKNLTGRRDLSGSLSNSTALVKALARTMCVCDDINPLDALIGSVFGDDKLVKRYRCSSCNARYVIELFSERGASIDDIYDVLLYHKMLSNHNCGSCLTCSIHRVTTLLIKRGVMKTTF